MVEGRRRPHRDAPDLVHVAELPPNPVLPYRPLAGCYLGHSGIEVRVRDSRRVAQRRTLASTVAPLPVEHLDADDGEGHDSQKQAVDERPAHTDHRRCRNDIPASALPHTFALLLPANVLLPAITSLLSSASQGSWWRASSPGGVRITWCGPSAYCGTRWRQARKRWVEDWAGPPRCIAAGTHGAIGVAAYLGAGTLYLHRDSAFGSLTVVCVLAETRRRWRRATWSSACCAWCPRSCSPRCSAGARPGLPMQ